MAGQASCVVRTLFGFARNFSGGSITPFNKKSLVDYGKATSQLKGLNPPAKPLNDIDNGKQKFDLTKELQAAGSETKFLIKYFNGDYFN